MDRDVEELNRLGVIGNCARRVTEECHMKNPLLCKVHHDSAMREKVAASWQTASGRIH